MESDGKDGMSVGRQPEVQGVFPSCGYAEIVQGIGGHRPVRVHISALSSEQVCSSLSRIKKNGVKDEGRTDNQLRVRAQALQPERPWPLDEEVLRGGGV